jgi:PTH1 family peptidyl-tRNA hydrolase
LEVGDFLVICDDIALPIGKLRARARGSDGGQKGLRSIETHLGTPDYCRLRVGIGSPGEYQDAADYVLERFSPGERPVIEDAIAAAAQGALIWVRQGIDACMNRVNAGPEKEKSNRDRNRKDKPRKSGDDANDAGPPPSMS